jgi:nucleotide-binding universal stress UspA family protein
MIKRVLVAVDDSPGGLAAARYGIDLAHDLAATIRVLTVLGDGELRIALRDDQGLESRRRTEADALLRHVSEMARRLGVPAEMVKIPGTVAACVLEQAREWPADLVVLGRSRGTGVGGPFIGSQARLVLEFADVPVLVIPPLAR